MAKRKKKQPEILQPEAQPKVEKSPKPKKASKKAIIEEKESEEFFVALNHAGTLKLGLLENTKKILESMKVFQELKEIRQQKIQEKIKLRKHIRKISVTITNLKKEMPHSNLPIDDIIPIPQTRIVNLPPKEPTEEEHATRSELNRIEAELSEIEAKLSSLHQS